MNDVNWESYDPMNWWIDRWGNMEFLSDQLFGDDDKMQPACRNEYWRNQYKPGYLPYVI